MRSRLAFVHVWIVSLLAGLLTACTGPSAAAQTAPLRLAWTYRESDYTLLLAKQMGLFERYGVQVEPVFYNSYPQARADLVAEVIDGGVFPIGDLILMASKTDLRGILVSDNGGAVTIVNDNNITINS